MSETDWSVYASYRDSRAFFGAVRRAVPRMDELRYTLEFGMEFSGCAAGRNPNPSDPTGNRAIYLADNEDALMRQAQRKIAQCEELIGVALVVIDAVRAGLGDRYADALDAHFVDCLSLHGCAHRLDISTSSVKRYLSIAQDWCDYQSHRLFTREFRY